MEALQQRQGVDVSRFSVAKTYGVAFTVECLDCGEAKSFPDKSYGRIAARMFQQDHICKELSESWVDPQCDEVADIDFEVPAQIRCKLASGHKGDCEPEG